MCSEKDYYNETRDKADALRNDTRNRLDYLLLIISSGTLVLTLNLFLFSEATFSQSFLLIASWVLLLIAIVSLASGYFFSERQSLRSIKILDDWKRDGFPPLFSVARDSRVKNWGRCIEVTNALAAITTIVGIFLLSLFIFINLNTMYSLDKEISPEEKKSVNLIPSVEEIVEGDEAEVCDEEA